MLAILVLMVMETYNVRGMVTVAANLDKPQRCTLERAYKMLGYNCAKMSFKTIPQNLKSNLEVSVCLATPISKDRLFVE
jgi:hypothetical protein